MVSITERMASMQSMYGQNAGPIDGNMTNDSDSNFQETALQIEDSNVNIWENPINQGQLSQDVKEVIPKPQNPKTPKPRGTQIELLKYLSYEIKFEYWTDYIIERDDLCLKELRLRRYKKIWSI